MFYLLMLIKNQLHSHPSVHSRGYTARHLAGPTSAMAKLLAAHERQPPHLTQCCRLAIRSQLGPERLCFIDRLVAPPILINFLK